MSCSCEAASDGSLPNKACTDLRDRGRKPHPGVREEIRDEIEIVRELTEQLVEDSLRVDHQQASEGSSKCVHTWKIRHNSNK